MAERRLKILLVEDNSSDVELVKESLLINNINCELLTAKDGVDALTHFTGTSRDSSVIDFILLDLNLPKIDGYTVLEKLKKDPLYLHIPIIIFTSSQAQDDIQKCYQLKANCYVTKPFVLDQFIDTVKSIVDFWSHTVQLSAAH